LQLNTPAETITGIQKAAILLITLGPVDSAKIIQHIPEDEANQLAKTIVQLDRIPPSRV